MQHISRGATHYVMHGNTAHHPIEQNPKFLDQLRYTLRSRHYSPHTRQTYCHLVKRYFHFHNVRHPAEINVFLTHLAVKEKASASTQNQALSALLFLYRHVLEARGHPGPLQCLS